MAPKEPGHYSYSVILRSDSYVDFDVVTPVKVIILILFILNCTCI